MIYAVPGRSHRVHLARTRLWLAPMGGRMRLGLMICGEQRGVGDAPMSRHYGGSTQIRQWLSELRGGDEAARAKLVNYSCDRLRGLAHRLFQGHPQLRRDAETADILQGALLRLYRALSDVHPDSVAGFIGLAALQIRRELLDLSRRVGGKRLRRNAREDPGSTSWRHEPADDTAGPATLAEWSEIHERVDQLPTDEREVFHLHYYAGITHSEAAEMLGVSVATVKRRWFNARLLLHRALHPERQQP